ncbi:hypothetical protein N7G274_000178 [Stereocaulon virgatum]|uniref:Cytochrome P450 n=1 Tax=Stereocaulon virgatum TaxID=373712 RepID=A0ABR4ARD3_9LECA
MFLTSYPLTLLQTLVLALISYTTYRLYTHLRLASAHRHLAASKGCKSPPNWRQSPFLFGLDIFYNSYKDMKAHCSLENTRTRFWALGANTVQMKLTGATLFSTIEPENVKSVRATDFKNWGLGEGRKLMLVPFIGEGIFTSDGAAWQHSRDMLRPSFVRNSVGDCDIFERHVQNLIKAIPRDGEMVDLQPLFLSLSLDVATEFLFGESTNSLSADDVDAETKEYARAIDHILKVLGGQEQGGLTFIGLMMGLFPPNWTLKGEYKVVHNYVDGFIDRAVVDKRRYELEKVILDDKPELPGRRYIFLHELLDRTTDRLKIRSELLNILLAGRDSTAALLSNMWFELSKRPAAWARLQQEVSALDGALPTFGQLKEMKYLRAFLNESLRLYPILPENNRTAQVDTVLPLGGGADGKSPILVKKGQIVLWSIHIMHRRKDIYGEDAEEFRPERWLDTEQGQGLRVGWEYLPFNGGPRICIGQQFALTEASYVTVRLMQEFNAIESKDPEPWREMFTVTCQGLGGCKIVLTP